MSAPAGVERAFPAAERRGVYRAIHSRRDVRTRFTPEPIEEKLFWRLLEAAHAAPSVGLMQPWRFIWVRAPGARQRLHDIVAAERLETATALSARGPEFLRLKVDGVRECAELLVVALKEGREAHVFGRRTLPEMDVASVGCAVENLWLAARAEGIGVGWVSLFEPDAVARALEMPAGSAPVGILCLGHVETFDPRPALELAGWARREPLADLVYEDRWGLRARAPTSRLGEAR